MSKPVLNPNFLFLSERLPCLRVALLQGGTRSGKTYATLQYLIDLACAYSGMVITIVRDGFPTLRASVLRDFLDILEEAGLYDEANESKPPGSYEYMLNGNLFEFFSADNAQKIKGRKRDILYINEADELDYPRYLQLAFRTTGRIIADYNPSNADGYIYEQLLPREDTDILITTYKDNPFLPQEIIDEVERLQDADEELWKVYGEGQRGNVSGAILQHKILSADSWPNQKGADVYGIDFGFTAPSAIIKTTFYDEAHYWKELLYERKLTNTALITRAKQLIPLEATIYADAAEPDRIEEFKEAGFINIQPAIKNIADGIDLLRSKPLFVHEDSRNLLAELPQYRYRKTRDGKLTEEPIAIKGDHGIDAGRYGAYSHTRLPKAHHRAYVSPTPKGFF